LSFKEGTVMPHPIQLIVGLANPGKDYADTRHNAGAWFVEDLAASVNASLRAESKYHGLHTLVKLHGQACHLLIPTTYMNLSGQAVRACMTYLKIPPEAVLIAHDEIDLPVGSIKLKFDGGDGGHNGLKDIIRHLNTKQFYRLRIGVGHPGNRNDVADYVLCAPSKADKQKIQDALIQATEILPLVMEGEMQKAIQQLHTAAS
jgi:PTH1 family peptidyl-tRNA hydrolase